MQGGISLFSCSVIHVLRLPVILAVQRIRACTAEQTSTNNSLFLAVILSLSLFLCVCVNQVWSAPLANGSTAVLLLNRLETPHEITAHWTALGIDDATTRKAVRDVSSRVDAGVMAGSLTATVPGHGAKLFKLSEPG